MDNVKILKNQKTPDIGISYDRLIAGQADATFFWQGNGTIDLRSKTQVIEGLENPRGTDKRLDHITLKTRGPHPLTLKINSTHSLQMGSNDLVYSASMELDGPDGKVLQQRNISEDQARDTVSSILQNFFADPDTARLKEALLHPQGMQPNENIAETLGDVLKAPTPKALSLTDCLMGRSV